MISEKMKIDIQHSSWVRAMFEEGARLKHRYGTDQVFDFSLGNPDYEPPHSVIENLKNLVDQEGMHRYTSNAGYPEVREQIAVKMQEESGLSFSRDHIVMTCGAAGGFNVVLKSILNPGDEVVVLAPYFSEYRFYVENHGGKIVLVNTGPGFIPDPQTLKKNITPACKAIILNSPNNPTGVVYSSEALQAISAVLEGKEKELKRDILVISDEPYNKLVYDHVKVPNLMKIFRNCIIVNSFSKSLALPGERIGYIAVSPQVKEIQELMNALVFANRTLGFVNAPAIFQKLVALSLDEGPDTIEYQKRRDLLYNHLIGLGFECVKPQGAFYLFPKSPIPDDVEFIKCALKYKLILVPGSGYAAPGYFRIAYCVNMNVIKGSLPLFSRLAAEFIGR